MRGSAYGNGLLRAADGGLGLALEQGHGEAYAAHAAEVHEDNYHYGVMFLPMGFLLPALKRRGLVKTALLSLAASLFIEGTQLFYCWCDVSNRRIFDVTDLIMNTAGGVCGCLIYLAARPALRRIDNELP